MQQFVRIFFKKNCQTPDGVEIADGPMRGLLARALVVIDRDGKVLGTSFCERITEEPDYQFALDLLK